MNDGIVWMVRECVSCNWSLLVSGEFEKCSGEVAAERCRIVGLSFGHCCGLKGLNDNLTALEVPNQNGPQKIICKELYQENHRSRASCGPRKSALSELCQKNTHLYRLHLNIFTTPTTSPTQEQSTHQKKQLPKPL